MNVKSIGKETKVTPVITKTEKDKLWDAGAMKLDNLTGLLRATFFYNGINFCLWGGMEHQKSELSQIKKNYCWWKDDQEFESKNNQEGFASLNLQNKVVRQHKSFSLRCHVKILKKYLQVLPAEAKKNYVLYLKPLVSVPMHHGFQMYQLVRTN